MKQRFIIEIDVAGDQTNEQWLTTCILTWGSHLFKSGDILVKKLPPIIDMEIEKLLDAYTRTAPEEYRG